jgi:type IV pilus assembly protein PilV
MAFAKDAGVSLIEVLVAVLVLALGVTGAAGMHLKALRTTHEAGLQSAALQLATELAERMRAHHATLLRGGGADRNPFLGLDHLADPVVAITRPQRLCYFASCDPEQLAEFDLYEAKLRLQASLPGGRIVVCRDAHPWQREAGRFTWDCDGDEAAPVVVKVGWQARNPDGSSVQTPDGQHPPAITLMVHP